MSCGMVAALNFFLRAEEFDKGTIFLCSVWISFPMLFLKRWMMGTFCLQMIYFFLEKVNVQQMHCVKEVMEEFCNMSGHQVSVEKISIYFFQKCG